MSTDFANHAKTDISCHINSLFSVYFGSCCWAWVRPENILSGLSALFVPVVLFIPSGLFVTTLFVTSAYYLFFRCSFKEGHSVM